jgi:hypothetical protein
LRDGTQGVSDEEVANDVHREPAAMSILERFTSPPQAPAAEWGPDSDRLRVITAGSVGNMEARLGTNRFDVVAGAETEDALIDAVSSDEPDAIVVEAELCDSLEQVRDLAPDAVLIAVGDHTPPGALGRVERGMSGTAMAGLLHALVAEGVGAAVVWGLVPTFRAGAALHVPQSVGESLLSAKADPSAPCERASRPRATRDHGGHRRGDRFREPSDDAERTAHVRKSGARPHPRAGLGARTAASGRPCDLNYAISGLWPLVGRGRAGQPTGAEPR